MHHRTMPPLPTDPAAIKTEIEWLLKHPLWTHPHIMKVPPNGQDWFQTRPVPGTDLVEMVPPGPDWVDEDVPDGSLQECLCIDYVFVNPATRRIEDDDSLNTQFEVWFESGGWFDMSEEGSLYGVPEGGWTKWNKWSTCHDVDLDCGAHTIEEALLKLAMLVRFYYTNDGKHREDVPKKCGGRFLDDDYEKWESDCKPAADGFCSVCGYEVG